MGTRFCATVEAPIHEQIKQALVRASERDTKLIFRTLHNTGRVLRNAVSDEVVATEQRPQVAASLPTSSRWSRASAAALLCRAENLTPAWYGLGRWWV